MGTQQENAAKREATVAEMEAQLNAWSAKLDDLVGGYLEAGAQSHDAYRIRIDGLRARLQTVHATLSEYKLANPAGEAGTWGTFQAQIKDDWAALETGLDDLTR